MPADYTFTHRFCERWIEKARGYDSTTLDGAFDKFFTLFVAFNRLYFQMARLSGVRGWNDRQMATKGFQTFVGTAALHEAFTTGRGTEDIAQLKQLIGSQGQFSLAVDRATDAPNQPLDESLRLALGSQLSGKVVGAVLESLYLIRCNMFHGRKDFEDRQLQLLAPALHLLEVALRTGLAHLP